MQPFSAYWAMLRQSVLTVTVALLLLLLLFPLSCIKRQRRAVEAVYEARPVPKDHQVPGDMQGSTWNVS